MFETLVSTLDRYPKSLLSIMRPYANVDANGVIFLDRDPAVFAHILNYMRAGELDPHLDIPTLHLMHREAD